MKKTPLLILLAITIIAFTVLGIAGKNSIYYNEEQNVIKTPYLSVVFTGINHGVYPWDLFNKAKVDESKAKYKERVQEEERLLKNMLPPSTSEDTDTTLAAITPTMAPTPEAKPSAVSTPVKTAAPKSSPTPTPTPTPEFPLGRLEPLRESTYDEYINHISADIYGDVGVLRAASYNFKKVNITYFDDALFIGDSRVVGLRNYTELSEHADFRCVTSLTISKVLTSDYKGEGSLEKLLNSKEYGKIYIMVGVNELGSGTTEDFMEQYTNVIDTIHEMEPDAKIFIQAIMNIDRERSTSDAVFNNTNIMGRNHAIATLADNETFFYIDVNEAVTDEDGFLRDDLRGDHLHLLGASNSVWLDFLLEHGV